MLTFTTTQWYRNIFDEGRGESVHGHQPLGSVIRKGIQG